ncbi:L-threonylcarbamoyladenylate synthase [Microlunatus antarcticus]|uniref:L-threonylcarbamoyladenylate synthase n=1 Tax=Microlunatus antarcticus TaxID=53388 RepID=A0A7W5JWB2_9ACTN|nr:tRNA threonylcarbamoyl adenosine modification protein (Sua5/YciO/YrdC/YwlC family) [Microlunatus antarcticus]
MTVEPEDEGESVEIEDREVDDATYTRYDCTVDDPAAIAEAVDAARRAVADGECIVLPTDTVYGIGADAFSPAAVQRLLDAKNRGRDMPPPVLIGDGALIRALATDVPDEARDLVEVHWPGPLTIVCRIQPSLRMDLGETDGTIALRVPEHELAREILRRTGPLAVSSANLSGRPAALTCDEAVDQLGDRVEVYLDGGDLGTAAEGGRQALPSTIVDFTRHVDGQLLRRGAIDLETLRQTLPGMRDLEEPEAVAAAPAAQPDPEPTPAAAAPDPAPSPAAAAPAQPDEPRVDPEPEHQG